MRDLLGLLITMKDKHLLRLIESILNHSNYRQIRKDRKELVAKLQIKFPGNDLSVEDLVGRISKLIIHKSMIPCLMELTTGPYPNYISQASSKILKEAAPLNKALSAQNISTWIDCLESADKMISTDALIALSKTITNESTDSVIEG